MGLSYYKYHDIRGTWVSLKGSQVFLDNFGVPGPGDTIPVCLYQRYLFINDHFMQPDFTIVRQPISHIIQISRNLLYHISSINEYCQTKKKTFGELLKNTQRVVILISRVARSKIFARYQNFGRTVKICVKKGCLFVKCLAKVMSIWEKSKNRN